MDKNELIRVIRKTLGPELLKPGFKGEQHCYIASEVYYFLQGGKDAGLKPMNMKHEGSSHWFIKDGDEVIDITVGQFNEAPDYSKARGRGFLTKRPSKRAQWLIVSMCRHMHEECVSHLENMELQPGS